jgi:hypothetical protein
MYDLLKLLRICWSFRKIKKTYLFDFCKELFGNSEIREQVRKNRKLGANFGISNENPNFLLHIIILRKISCTIDYLYIFCDSRFREFREHHN